MICFFCHKPIRGTEVPNRYEWRRQGEDILTYGNSVPGRPLRAARGQLVKLAHNKCFHAEKKQRELAEARAADPSAQPRPDTDWRHQDVMDVEDLKGEGNRAD